MSIVNLQGAFLIPKTPYNAKL